MKIKKDSRAYDQYVMTFAKIWKQKNQKSNYSHLDTAIQNVNS